MVTITAPAEQGGKPFACWKVEAGDITLAEETARQTTFVMGSLDVEVTACYDTKDSPTPPRRRWRRRRCDHCVGRRCGRCGGGSRCSDYCGTGGCAGQGRAGRSYRTGQRTHLAAARRQGGGADPDAENGGSDAQNYRVIDAGVTGQTATVRYFAAGTADLVVGIYSTDSKQLLASGTIQVE